MLYERLPSDVRRAVERWVGCDLSVVRIHRGLPLERLGVAALAAGRSLFFAEGRYTPTTPAGRYLLMHELAHVLQQLRTGLTGRRRPGPVWLLDSALEDQADHLARWLLARMGWPTPPRIVRSPLGVCKTLPLAAGLVRVIAPALDSWVEVLQPRMGFEFETGVYVWRKAGPDWFQSFTDEKKFYAGNGWKIVSDSGRMEFVSKPMADLVELRRIVAEIRNFIDIAKTLKFKDDLRGTLRTRGIPGTWSSSEVSANQTVHISADAYRRIDVKETTFLGNPQVSVGVEIDHVARFLSEARIREPLMQLRAEFTAYALQEADRQQLSQKKRERLSQIDQIGRILGKSRIRQLDPVFPNVDALINKHARFQPNLKLRSLWTLMMVYWERLFRHDFSKSYLKSSLPILARTDFHSMYAAMTDREKAAYRSGRQDFVNPLQRGGRAKLEHLFLVYNPAGRKVTVGEWYDSVEKPTSTSWREIKKVRRPVDLTSDPELIATGTNKSMGQLGLDTHGNGSRVVFELRRVTGGIRIPINLLYQQTLIPLFYMVQDIERPR